MGRRVLFISNGHGEDHESSCVISTLKTLDPSLDMAALPLVGEGAAYRRLGVPIIAPTLTLPSGGFAYMNRGLFLHDLKAGLLGSTLRQWRAMRRAAPACDLVVATGDVVSQFFAFASRRPFVSFLASLSALYRGRLRLDPPLRFFLRSSRCLRIVSRDPATAADLGRQGFDKARFGGIPGLDYLAPTGRDLRARDATIVGLLPGSRPPEATRNLHLLMRLARIAAEMMAADASLPRISFRAATVPALLADIPALARTASWTWRAPETLAWSGDGAPAEILCFGDAYADIVDASALVVSMAGLAVDQAVGLGKPAILIPGEGPQHTYRFAEAQSRLLGPSTRVVGAAPATDRELREAARHMFDTVRDRDALSRARAWGLERFGGPGASRRIADMIVAELARAPAYAPH